MTTQVKNRNVKNRIAVRLGFRSWKHLTDTADRGYVFNLSSYPNLRQLFDRYNIKYWTKGIREKTEEE